MKRKSIAMFLCTVLIAFCSGCGTQTEEAPFSLSAESFSSEESNPEEKGTAAENGTEKESEREAGKKAETGAEKGTEKEPEKTAASESAVSVEPEKTGQIQKELAEVERKSLEFENADWSSMGQQEMNQLTAQWYQLWDEELNVLWKRISEEADAQTKAELLEEQRAWIKTKEGNVKAAGEEALGGSLQPQLENTAAEEMTRARSYLLAGYLADIRKETFAVPADVQESIDKENPSLDTIFQKFEGQWIFDEKRGACVGVQRTEDCTYGVEGSSWTVWVTGGDIFSDLDVYGYTEIAILFKVEYADSEAYYKLFRNMEDTVCLAYGTTFEGMDDIIVCN